MTEANDRFEIRRILVALDASPRSLARVEAAARLAASFKAELIGLFVEDVNLLRAAELPFCREISMFSSACRQMGGEHIQQELRAQAEWIRRSLAAAAKAREVPWIFRVARGAVAEEILAVAPEADLMILGKTTWAPPGARYLGSTVRTLMMQGRGLTLVLHEETAFTPPVSVIYDGSELSSKALNVAAHLSQDGDDGLKVLILAPDRDRAGQIKAEVQDKLEKRESGLEFILVIGPSLSSLTRLVQLQVLGPLVLPISLLQGEDLCGLVNEIPNPVFLVR